MNVDTARMERATREELLTLSAARIANDLRAAASLVTHYALSPREVRQVLESFGLLGSSHLRDLLAAMETAAACQVCGTGGAPGPREMAGQRRRLPADNRVRVLTDPACEALKNWDDGTAPPINV